MFLKRHRLHTAMSVIVFSALSLGASPLLASTIGETPPDTTNSSEDLSRAFSRAGDAKRGKIVFMRCKACHNEYATKNTKTGPNLDRFFGQLSGQSKGYDGYSKALKDAAIVWNESEIDAWLKNPKGFLPGNKMNFAGVRTQKDRNDLIAYLRSIQAPNKP